ncbi:MAG: tRNA pseudouridine(38-40) synthase TruA [Blastocatellia bacterium]
MNYRAVIAFDGTDFQGWQLQEEGKPTIQGAITAALNTLAGMKVTVHGAGRTDSGVHARGQVASFRLPAVWEPLKLRAAVNANLPAAIRVLEIAQAPDDFHARVYARGKTYRYQLDTGAVADPLLARYSWHQPSGTPRLIDLELLLGTGGLLLGTHDFTVFTVAACETKTRTRTLTDFRIEARENMVALYFCGNGFLRYQVRRMVSALLALNKRGWKPATFTELISMCEEARATQLAPARGLTLMKVEY